MLIKSKAILFRNFLYLNEVIKLTQISAAAEKNGIKAANLSKIIKDLENTIQKQLFIRTNKGLIPTAEAIRLSKLISQSENLFNNISAQILNHETKKTLNLFIPNNIEIRNLHLFNEAKILFCNDETNADVIISYKKPNQLLKIITVENSIGNTFNQKIWVSAINSTKALNLARFIICQLHL